MKNCAEDGDRLFCMATSIEQQCRGGLAARVLLIAVDATLSAPGGPFATGGQAIHVDSMVFVSHEAHTSLGSHVRPAAAVILTTLTLWLQGMRGSVRLTPHTSDPQDVLAAWHALTALPSQIHAITDHLQQQLLHLQTVKQQEMPSLADAKADLMGCLEAVAGNDQGRQVMVHAVGRCMLSAADTMQVSLNSRLA